MLGKNPSEAEAQQYLAAGIIRPATEDDKPTMWTMAKDAGKGAAVAAISVVVLSVGATLVFAGGVGGSMALAIGVAGCVGAVGGAAAGVAYGYKRRIKLSSSGLILPDMEIERRDEVDLETGEKHAVVELKHVRILDQEVFDRAIEVQERYQDNTKYVAVLPNFAKEPEYSVKITLKGKDLTLAELDYTNWDNNGDFKIEVMDATGKPASEIDRNRVLETLGGMSKFLGEELQHPGELVEDALGVGDKLKVNLRASPSKVVQSDVFLEELADVVIRTGRYEIFTGYERAIKDTYEKTDTINLIAANAEAGVAKSYSKNCFRWRLVLRIVGVVFLAVAVLGAIGVGVALSAPASIPVIVLGAIMSASIIAITVGSIASVASFVLSWGTFRLMNLAVSCEAAATAANEVKSAHELSQKERLAGIQKTKGIIENLSKHHQEITKRLAQGEIHPVPSLTLDLSHQGVGNSAAIIVGRWMGTSYAKFCSTINLSHNRITDDGAVSLAKGLADVTNIREIDITGNRIGDRGLEALSEALAKNTQVTKFAYRKEGIDSAIVSRIEKELLINNFLSNPNPSDAKIVQGVETFWGGDFQTLHQAAVHKIKQLTTLPTMAEFVQGFSENVQVALKERGDSEIKRMVTGLKHEVIVRQVELLFHEKPLSKNPQELDRALVTYIDIYRATNEPTAWQRVDQQSVLRLLKNALAEPAASVAPGQLKIRTPEVSPGLRELLKLDEAKRVSLLSDGLANETLRLKAGEVRGLAVLISSAISVEGFYDGQVEDDAILELRKCFRLVEELDHVEKISLDEYTAHLEAKKGGFANQELIEQMLQAVYRGKLEGALPWLLSTNPPSAEELARLKEYLKNETNLRAFKFPEPNGFTPEVTLAIEETCKRNQLLTILQKPHSAETLEQFLAVFRTMKDPAYLRTTEFDLAGLIRLLSLNEEVLTTDSDVLRMVAALRSVPKEGCRVLLEIYFQGQKEWGISVNFKEKARLVTTMIHNDGFIAMLGQGTQVLETMPNDILKGAFNYNAGSSHVVGDYVNLLEILNANIVYSLDEKPTSELVQAKEVYEEILQVTLQEELERDYVCLRSPFGTQDIDRLLEKLDENLYLRRFNFVGKDRLDPQLSEKIAQTIRRNKLFDEIKYALLHSRTLDEQQSADIAEAKLRARLDTGFDLLIEAYRKDLEVFMDYFKSDSIELGAVRDLILTNISRLRQEEDIDLYNNLLKLCFSLKEAEFKAALVANIFAYLPSLPNEEMRKILTSVLEENIEGLQEKFIKSGGILQQLWIQTELESKYRCLQTTLEQSELERGLEQLKGELGLNHELTHFFISEGKIDLETVDYINSICNRNVLEKYVNVEKPDLEIFFGRLNMLSPADGRKLVVGVDKEQLIKLFQNLDLGVLRSKLDVERAAVLLERYFEVVPNPENAYEKALMVAELLQKDPENQALNEIIKYAIKPWVGKASAAVSLFNYLKLGDLVNEEDIAHRPHLQNEPYYNLKEIQTKLGQLGIDVTLSPRRPVPSVVPVSVQKRSYR